MEEKLPLPLAIQNFEHPLFLPSPKKKKIYEYDTIRPKAAQGRNEKCNCASGKKYKHCCLKKLAGG